MPVKKVGPHAFVWSCSHCGASGAKNSETSFDAERELNKHIREEHS